MSALPFRLPPPRGGRVDLLVVAGEHSGDAHAARAVRDLLARSPGTAVAALGGPDLAAAGAQVLHDLTSASVVGLAEVLKNLSFFRALLAETIRWIAAHRPRAVCLVDYPGFNLRLAEALRARGLTVKGGGSIRCLYYISPQIWAWKGKRRFAMARNLDALAVIFPFEARCYADTALPVEFVGHPFADPDYTLPIRHDPAGPILLLPGSRQQAVGRIFPAMLAGFRALGQGGAVVLYPSDEVAAVLRRILDSSGMKNVSLEAIEGRADPPGPTGGPGRPALPIGAAAVLTSSGTMSMQCALAGIPGAVVYRANPLTYLLGRWLVRVRYLGIANLMLESPMYPEFIQGAAVPSALAAELRRCLEEPDRRTRTAEQAAALRRALAGPAAGSAGEWLHRHLE